MVPSLFHENVPPDAVQFPKLRKLEVLTETELPTRGHRI
jgi:hypothetical protein